MFWRRICALAYSQINLQMDSYSNMIISAVQAVKNAVVKIDVYKTVQGKLKAAGSGSGFVFFLGWIDLHKQSRR